MWQTFDETIVVLPTAHYFVFGVNSYFGTTIYVDDCWVTEVNETILKGDVNGDDVVDLTDIVGIANALLGMPSETYDAVAADVNDDGEVTAADIVAIAGIIQEMTPLPAFTSVIQYKSYAKVLNTYERTIKGQSKSLSSPARLGVSTGPCPFLCCKQERKDAA